jgi:hypothetical protein
VYDRALEGYKEGLGVERTKTYIPTLNTFENIANLYKKMGSVGSPVTHSTVTYSWNASCVWVVWLCSID